RPRRSGAPDGRGPRAADRHDQLRGADRDLAARAAGLPPRRRAGVSDPLEELSRLAQDGWLVGGAVRDRLLGRATGDFDVAVDGDVQPLARRLARATRAHAFELSEGFGAWRVTARDRSWQLDLLPLTRDTIEDDLRQRDLTVNAI